MVGHSLLPQVRMQSPGPALRLTENVLPVYIFALRVQQGMRPLTETRAFKDLGQARAHACKRLKSSSAFAEVVVTDERGVVLIRMTAKDTEALTRRKSSVILWLRRIVPG